jgi:hypothetical protein
MKQSTPLLLIILTAVFIIMVPVGAYSQPDSSKYLNDSDRNKKASSSLRNCLYLGMGGGSNLIYLGSVISKKLPFSYTSLSYGFNNELFVSVSGVHLQGIDPYIPFYSGSVLYSHVFNSWFDISTGISASKFAASLTDSLLTSFIYGDISLGVDLRVIYTKIIAGGMFSDESNAYFQFRNSRYFKTPEFGRHKAFIAFDPYINIIAGTYIKSEYRTITTIKGIESSLTFSDKFGLMEYDFGLPVSINFKRFSLEAEGGYVLPAYSDRVLPGPEGFVFMLSGSIKIF